MNLDERIKNLLKEKDDQINILNKENKELCKENE
jgi:hypothetical protein